jgi:Tol biopolymer transport system component
MTRFGAVIGGNTVAYEDFIPGSNGDVFVYDLVTGTATNLSQSFETDGNPAVAPGGDVVVWERCVGSNCDILQSVRSGATWGAPTVVAAPTSYEANPDTDGTTVVTTATGRARPPRTSTFGLSPAAQRSRCR